MVVFMMIPVIATAQNKKVVVMGSSSAYGYFPNTSIPRDSSWAFKVSKHYKDAGVLDTLYNIGTPGIDCYVGMPTGFTPPAGRNAPNPQFNITKAVSFNPDVIIINFPSNNYTFLTTTEIINCLQAMKAYAESFNITVFVTTTQPRDDFTQQAEREKLRALKDLILSTFGVYALDFWTPIVQDPPIIIKPEFALGDGVHLNPAGHTALKNVVIAKDIFFSTVATGITNFNAITYQDEVRLEWNIENADDDVVHVEKKNADGNFETIGYGQTQLNGNGSFTDQAPSPGSNYYRIKVDDNGTVLYSNIVYVRFDGAATNTLNVYPNPVVDVSWMTIPYSHKPATIQLFTESGRLMRTYQAPLLQTRMQLSFQGMKRGNYILKYYNDNVRKSILINVW